MVERVDVKELGLKKNWGFWCDYTPILNAFGKIVCRVDDDEYQGDSRVLYDDGYMVGILVFGWGSCSGCDALQACSTIDDVQELCDELQDKIHWFADKKTALEFINSHDWEGDYSWHREETKKFIAMASLYLLEEN